MLVDWRWSIGAGHCMAQSSFGLPKYSFGEHEMNSEIFVINK